MTRPLLVLTTGLACAGLAAVIVAIAVSSASGTPRGSLVASPRLTGGAPLADPPLPSCSMSGSRGASELAFRGVCTGRLQETFACLRRLDELALSVRRPLGGRD